MEDVELKIILDKINFYYNEKQAIHIELKNSQFYNGCIEVISHDFIMLHEMKLGVMPIYFNEIEVIEPYRERGEEDRK